MVTVHDVGGPSPSRRRGAAVLVAVVVVVLVAAAWWWRTTSQERAEQAAADRMVERFAVGWEQGDLAGIPSSVRELTDRFVALTEGLDAAAVTVEPGPVSIVDLRATSELDVTWQLPGDQRWNYRTTVGLLRLVGDDPMWQVDWTTSTVHPQLVRGARLEAERRRPTRGEILDADGDPLVTLRPVVKVFVQPSDVDDVDDLAADLEDALDIDGEALAERVADADEDALVPVITLREDDFEDVEDDITALPGTEFEEDELPLTPNRRFARALLGTVGEVTAEQLEQQPQRYRPGDLVGQSGLQQRLDERLGGTAGMTVSAVTDRGGDEDDHRSVLYEVETRQGQDITITLRRRVQRAADAALADIEQPSALVAIDVPSGDVVAVANGPGAAFDIATGGQYPPGSVFKVVTTARLLADGLEPDDDVGCPQTVTIDGRTFRNAEDAALGGVPFETAFAQSCNTAFVNLSEQLDPGALALTAREQFGIGTRGDLGIGAFAGEVPEEESAVEVAAAAIGQGRVLVSPVIAADMAATVDRGEWLEPRLVLEPSQGAQQTADALSDAKQLRKLTRAVVTRGSGTALANVPGPRVRGKTGTAEYGDDDPPRTHAWVIGSQDDLAFAVLVAETEDSFGGDVAAPIAADFLTRLR